MESLTAYLNRRINAVLGSGLLENVIVDNIIVTEEVNNRIGKDGLIIEAKTVFNPIPGVKHYTYRIDKQLGDGGPGRQRHIHILYNGKQLFALNADLSAHDGCHWVKIPNEIVPFDYDTYWRNPATFEVVATNCLTGRAEYLTEKKDALRLTAIIKASSSLPYVAHVTYVDGIPMLDGGIVDSIPIQHSIETGHSENVVVLTRNRGFRSNEFDLKVPKLRYGEYPRLRVALSHHVEAYNSQLEMIERMEDWGEIVVIRPQRPMEVDRICRDVEKLERLYEEGFAEGERFCKSLK